MKKETSSNLLEKIDVAKERIKELETMINHWKGIEVEGFWDAECSIIYHLWLALSLIIDLQSVKLKANASKSSLIKNYSNSLIND